MAARREEFALDRGELARQPGVDNTGRAVVCQNGAVSARNALYARRSPKMFEPL